MNGRRQAASSRVGLTDSHMRLRQRRSLLAISSNSSTTSLFLIASPREVAFVRASLRTDPSSPTPSVLLPVVYGYRASWPSTPILSLTLLTACLNAAWRHVSGVSRSAARVLMKDRAAIIRAPRQSAELQVPPTQPRRPKRLRSWDKCLGDRRRSFPLEAVNDPVNTVLITTISNAPLLFKFLSEQLHHISSVNKWRRPIQARLLREI